MNLWLILVAFVVGVMIGAVGIGGLLLVPAIAFLAHLPVQTAMATALLSFIFTGVLGTFLFHQRGSIDWYIARPVCTGAAISGFFGAWANSRIDPHTLIFLLASVIAVAGVNTAMPRSIERPPVFSSNPGRQQILLFWIGAVCGFGSGLTGVGGPALSVPMLLLFGFSPLSAIGASQVIQILAAISGTLGNLRYGTIDFQLAAVLIIVELLGVHLGVRIVHALNPRTLRSAVAIFCVLVSAGLILRSLNIV
ncbi:sulfite exporter TauE/SafE family protein [Glaciimonas immobilis]|uniref:Probable membrane transporter protein n=1 Tax=Glaciimonas immobilis TaxID=728004 RepID=A0A840RRL7_9BURK|nr:sulfite exporter TauE/SafE family protein [Glaciimonas immobilis]KAF3996511.1 sulfite exporter TauE/SafE family protein [Glaciimonas immobilis]MBB5201127.1 hypothetical protein [Glaciimonas immobilis]